MRIQRVVAETVVAVTCVAFAAGCTASVRSEPLAGSDTRVAAASASPSDRRSAPQPPADAEGTSPAAAQAFVKYWIEALNFAARTGRTHALREASAPQCSSCQGVITGVEQIHAAGGYYRGDSWSLNTMKYEHLQPATQPVVTVGVEVMPQALAGGAGAGPRVFDEGEHSMIFWLTEARTGEGWVVRQLEPA